MLEFIDKNDIFSDTQYGFRKKKSTEAALLDFTKYIYDGLLHKQNIGSIFMDLSKAFDVIDHSILKTKLEHYGFRGIFLNLLTDFIKDRKYFLLASHGMALLHKYKWAQSDFLRVFYVKQGS